MQKKFVFLALLMLTGCATRLDMGTEELPEDIETVSIEEITASPFVLTAAQGYVNPDNYTTPHTYVVDTHRKEVYVDRYEEPSGLTPEEIIENAAKGEVVESAHPIFEMDSLGAEEDSLSLQYDSKIVEFTPLSDSYYENQDGIRYILEPHEGIDQYIESFFE